jgi:stage III sporulation protein AB
MIRILGALFLLLGCGGFGIAVSAAHRREVKMLKKLKGAVMEMEWELKYRMTELPELCMIAGNAAGGVLKDIFLELSNKLKRCEIVDISASVNGILSQHDLPGRVRRNMRQLGTAIGRFDLEGQLQGLAMIRHRCIADIQKLEENSSDRLRCYRMMAWCGGAALAILLI